MSGRPDWRQVALRRAYDTAMVRRHRWREADMARFQMSVGPRYTRNLADAAALRGLTTVAYVRRAVAAFIAADLGLEFTDVISDTPHPRGQTVARYDDGAGHGSWSASPFVDDMGGIQAS